MSDTFYPLLKGSEGRFEWLGRVSYDSALELQKGLHREMVSDGIPDTVLALEHDHSITVGRAGSLDNLMVSQADIIAAGGCLRFPDRGGDITYHGPGQMVVYPILDLGGPFPDLERYLRALEKVIVLVLSELGVQSRPVPGVTGVWTSHGKIAAVGVKVTRGVSYHGFSINLNPDLEWFDKIIPCGLKGRRVTSVAEITGHEFNYEQILTPLGSAFREVFGLSLNTGTTALLREGA